MSYLLLIALVLLAIVAIVFISDLVKTAGFADPEDDYEEGDEEVVAMGGQVDESDCQSEEDEEPSEEEETKS